MPSPPKLVSSVPSRVVAGEREVAVGADRAADGGEPGDDDLAVGLHGDRVGLVDRAGEVGRDDAVAAEARVEGAVGLVADDAEVAVGAGPVGAPDDHEAAVGMQRRSNASSVGCPRSVVTMPSVPKPASSLPSASWRVSAKSMPPSKARRPAVMIAPSDWMSTASPLPAPTGVDTLPSLPNVGSSPGGGAGVRAMDGDVAVTSAPSPCPCRGSPCRPGRGRWAGS